MYFQLHTILPSSAGLAVACVPQAAQGPLRQVVSTLRTEPALLAETLYRAGTLSIFLRSVNKFIGYMAVDQDKSFKSTYPLFYSTDFGASIVDITN